MTEKTNQDGYESALLGHRPMSSALIAGCASAEMLYAQGGLYSRVIDLPADKAVSRGVEIEGDVDGAAGDELDRLNVLSVLADALRWARLSGGAGIVLLADDAAANEPLDPVALGTIEEIQVFPLTAFKPHGLKYSDPTKKNYNQPEWYRVNNGSASFTVHETRIIPVPGDPLPLGVNQTGVPWAGRSAADRAYRAIARYTEALDYANRILQRKQQAVYGMKGLAELVLRKQEYAVQSRINLVDSVRGVLNTVATDTEDSYTIIDTSLSGIKDVIGEQKVAVSTDAGIPVTLLFGESPGGMNATGEADFAGWHEMVEGLQRTRATPALERLLALIFAQNTFAQPLEDWKIVWPPLDSPSETEAATTRKTNAEAEKAEMSALDIAIGAGLLSEQQGIDYLVATDRYNLGVKTDARASSKAYAQQTE